MTHTTFRFDRECPCYECLLVPMCQNKRNSRVMMDCILIRQLVAKIYEELKSDEDNIKNITITFIPIDKKIEFSKSSLYYWGYYRTKEKS